MYTYFWLVCAWLGFAVFPRLWFHAESNKLALSQRQAGWKLAANYFRRNTLIWRVLNFHLDFKATVQNKK